MGRGRQLANSQDRQLVRDVILGLAGALSGSIGRDARRVGMDRFKLLQEFALDWHHEFPIGPAESGR